MSMYTHPFTYTHTPTHTHVRKLANKHLYTFMLRCHAITFILSKTQATRFYTGDWPFLRKLRQLTK